MNLRQKKEREVKVTKQIHSPISSINRCDRHWRGQQGPLSSPPHHPGPHHATAQVPPICAASCHVGRAAAHVELRCGGRVGVAAWWKRVWSFSRCFAKCLSEGIRVDQRALFPSRQFMDSSHRILPSSSVQRHRQLIEYLQLIMASKNIQHLNLLQRFACSLAR